MDVIIHVFLDVVDVVFPVFVLTFVVSLFLVPFLHAFNGSS